MILDNLENLDKYDKIVTPDILDFVKGLNVNTVCRRYEISDKVYANVEEYCTKSELECPLEGHRKYIDIQMLLFGEERIDFIKTDGLKILDNYNPERDILFYKKPGSELNRIYLNGRNFAVFYPEDAHAPQITTLSLQNNVKKVVIKVAVDWL